MTFLQAPDLPYRRITYDFWNLPNSPTMPSGWSSRSIQGDAASVGSIWNGYVRAYQTLSINTNSRSLTTFDQEVLTDDQIVRGTTLTAVNGLFGGIALKMDAAMQNGVVGVLSTGVDRGIWVFTNGTGTNVSGSGFTLSHSLGDTWAFRALGNVYSLIRNPNNDNAGGTVVVSWTDTTSRVKHGPSYRRGGFFLNSDRNIINQQNWGVGWDGFDFRDLGWTA